MRGLDGNYINTQGDALARIQVAYQAEQNRLQIRAQTESVDALRKLREQVNETERKSDSTGPGIVKGDQGSTSGPFYFYNGDRTNSEPDNSEPEKEDEGDLSLKQIHIDIRV